MEPDLLPGFSLHLLRTQGLQSLLLAPTILQSVLLEDLGDIRLGLDVLDSLALLLLVVLDQFLGFEYNVLDLIQVVHEELLLIQVGEGLGKLPEIH